MILDYCLVTHLHFDHFCPDYLPKDLRIIAQNHEEAEKISQKGFENVVAFESENLTIGNIVIHKTKAIHGDNDEVVEKMGDVCGYIFEDPGEKCLYIAADTVYCLEVEQTLRKYRPEIIILNCCEGKKSFRYPGSGRLRMYGCIEADKFSYVKSFPGGKEWSSTYMNDTIKRMLFSRTCSAMAHW